MVDDYHVRPEDHASQCRSGLDDASQTYVGSSIRACAKARITRASTTSAIWNYALLTAGGHGTEEISVDHTY